MINMNLDLIFHSTILKFLKKFTNWKSTMNLNNIIFYNKTNIFSKRFRNMLSLAKFLFYN